ncbi:MAG: hypothetical protein Kow0090_17160 [Myxococcota bacterium]
MEKRYILFLIAGFLAFSVQAAGQEAEELKLGDEPAQVEKPSEKKGKAPLEVIIKGEGGSDEPSTTGEDEPPSWAQSGETEKSQPDKAPPEKEDSAEGAEEGFVPWGKEEGIPTAPEDRDFRFSAGATMKARAEMAENVEDLNSSRYDFDLRFGHRIRGFVLGEYKDALRLKASIQDARYWGEESATSDLWLDGLSRGFGTVLHEGYIEIDKPGGAPILLRAGRMELSYGSELIIGRDDWNLVSNAFDAALLRTMFKELDVDIFYSRVRAEEIIVHPYGPCSQTVSRAGCMASGEHLAGIDLRLKTISYMNAEFYTFFTKSSPVQGDTLTREDFTDDDSTLVTMGIFTSDPGKGEAVYRAELDFQFGKVPSGDFKLERESHRAFALMLKGGYRGSGYLKPLVVGGYAFATGDDKPSPEDSVSGAFRQLFPSNHEYFGVMDLAGLSNIHNINLSGRITPVELLELELSLNYFLLQKYRDGWRGADGETIGKSAAPGYRTFYGFYDRSGNSGLPVGFEIDFIADWSPIKHLSLKSESGLFFPGTFPKSAARLDENKLPNKTPLLGGNAAFLWLITTSLAF